MTPIATAAALSLVVTAALMPLARLLAVRQGYLDVPNAQSSHARPTPRVGGYAMLAGLVAAVIATGGWRQGRTAVIAGGALVLASAAFVDDRRPLPRRLRLALQCAIAAVVIWAVAPPSPVWWMAGLVWMVAVVNAYNFMDGLNGMAGIAAVVTGISLAVLFARQGDTPAAVLAIAMAGAAAGFLPYNLFTGSVFMGDAGSTSLGLVFGALALGATSNGSPGFVAMLPLTPFVLDAWTTIVRRALRGERFFSTRHRTSFYQLLQQLGWRHESVAAIYGALTLISGGVALLFDRLSGAQQGFALVSLGALHATVFFLISRSFHAARLRREA
jgi:UDP-N-acetylmuramyl pentapeptide phosphotransferase/UDP-N-acetylglucosamine-1-phosphate transferase